MNRIQTAALLVIGIVVPAMGYAEPFRVGTILPLSGPLAEFGVAFQNGISMAKADRPEAFGECELIIEDSKYEPQTAITILQNFARGGKLNMAYSWGGRPSEPLAPIAESMKFPLFVWSADPKIAKNRKWVARFCNQGKDYAAVVAGALRKRGLKEIVMIRAQNQYIEAIYSGFEENLGTDLKILVSESVTPGELDFRAFISKLKQKPPQAIGVFLISGQVAQFYRQLAEQKVSIPTFGTDFFDSVTEVKDARGGMDGAMFSANTVSKDFHDRYLAKYKNDLQITHAGNGYDFALYACTELAKHPKDFISKLGSTTPPNWAQGPATYKEIDGDRYFYFPVALKLIKGETISEAPVE